MRAKEFEPKKLVIFDIDDTLVHTQTKVHVVKDGETIKSLNSHDFTHYKLQPGESFDFGDFRNAREFFEKSRPIIPMMNQLKRDIATGNKVVMVTARADFDDKELFLDTFRKYGVDIDKVHVYRAGNSKQGTTEERKKAIIKNLLDKDNFSKAIMYDDAKPNLHSFIELKQDYPDTRFYAWHVSLEGEASEYMREDFTDEGVKDWMAAGALGTALAFGSPGDAEAAKKKPTDVIQQVSKKDIAKSVTGNPHEVFLKKEAEKAGIKGSELAAFLAQCAHETLDFKHMKEIGGSLDFKKYDIKHAPKKAKVLGNTKPGDGAKYKGRGYIQLTGKYNYKKAGDALGLPLVEKPELLEKPEVAAKVAVWYWKTRVKPNVDNFKDTKTVTKPINPGMKHLDQRKEKHQEFMVAMK